jgi:hypothetical protein
MRELNSQAKIDHVWLTQLSQGSSFPIISPMAVTHENLAKSIEDLSASLTCLPNSRGEKNSHPICFVDALKKLTARHQQKFSGVSRARISIACDSVNYPVQVSCSMRLTHYSGRAVVGASLGFVRIVIL